MEIKDILQEAGLTSLESQIYLGLLKLGQSKMHNLRGIINLPRTTIYNTLDSLIKKGYSSYVTISGVKYFQASSPEKILQIIREREKSFEKAIPQLKEIQKSVKTGPSTEIYQGKEGLKTVLEDLKKDNPKEEFIITNSEIFKLLGFYFPHHLESKQKLGIKTKIMGVVDKESLDYIKEQKSKMKLHQFKQLPPKLKIPSRIQSYGNKLIIINQDKEELTTILIKDKKIAETFKSLYEFMWEKSSKIKI